MKLDFNNYNNVLSYGISSIRSKELHSDVTIISGEIFFPSNKLILSICSDYFHNILQKIDCPKPFIILNDISPEIFSKILDFIYKGKVDIKEEDVKTFLDSCKVLKIKGLNFFESGSVTNDDDDNNVISMNKGLKIKRARKRPCYEAPKPLSKKKITHATFKPVFKHDTVHDESSNELPVPNILNKHGSVRFVSKLAQSKISNNINKLDSELDKDFETSCSSTPTNLQRNFSGVSFRHLVPEITLSTGPEVEESENEIILSNKEDDDDSDIEILSESQPESEPHNNSDPLPLLNGGIPMTMIHDPLDVFNHLVANVANFSQLNDSDDDILSHQIFHPDQREKASSFEGFDESESGPKRYLALINNPKIKKDE